jgi:archaellum biogenesis protein FlaJ (TadC family)
VKRHLPAVVVAGWGGLNGLLLAVLAIYGEDPMTYWLWGSVVVLLQLAAVLVLVSSRRGPDQHVRYRVPVQGAAAVPLVAVTALLIGLSFVYGFWLLALAVPLLAVAVAIAVRGTALRER